MAERREGFTAIAGLVVALVIQIVAIAWWGATLTASQKATDMRMQELASVVQENVVKVGDLRERMAVHEAVVCPLTSVSPSPGGLGGGD